MTSIEKRLPTAFYPQTDGATERMNQEIQAYLRAFVTYAQTNWSELLPAAQLAINNRDSSLSYSPFFLTHGFHVSPFPLNPAHTHSGQSINSAKSRQADKVVKKLEEGQGLAQAAMAWRQQAQSFKWAIVYG